MKFNLFFTGTPGNKDTLPTPTNSIDSSYMESLFNMPSTTEYHSADFFVEAFPKDRKVFYTYLHRRNVAGLQRENAYMAIVLRTEEEYFEAITIIYRLLEEIYEQYIRNKIIVKHGKGEKFISEIRGQENLRAKAEEYLLRRLQDFDLNSYAMDGKFRQSKEQLDNRIMTVDEDDRIIVERLQRTFSVHLIPATDYLNKNIRMLEQEVSNMNATNDKLREENESKKKRITELENDNVKKGDQINRLSLEKNRLEEENKKVRTSKTQYSYNQDTADKINVIYGKVVDFNTSNLSPQKNHRITPFRIATISISAISLILLGILTYRSYHNNPGDGTSEKDKKIQTLQNDNIQLQNEVGKHDATIQILNDSINKLNGQLNNVKKLADNGTNTKEANKTPRIDIGGNVARFEVGQNLKVTLLDTPKGATWELTEKGREYMDANMQQGTVSFKNAYSGKENLIQAKDREGKIIAQRTVIIQEEK